MAKRPGNRNRRAAGLAVAAWAALASPLAAPAAQTRSAIAVAENFKFAVLEIGAELEKRGHRYTFSVGSSGRIAQQIRHGAPFGLFLSADVEHAELVVAAGLAQGPPRRYAVGRLAIYAPHGSPIAVDGELLGLKRALAEGRVRRFALASPELAPYGRRGREALMKAGLWEAIRDRLVFGDSVAQAAQFAMTGNADGGLVAYSLTLAPEISERGRAAVVPAEWHGSLAQAMVLLRGADPAARALFDFLAGAEARPILERHGFESP
jgi:molybdate transport system substrate-binding protein